MLRESGRISTTTTKIVKERKRDQGFYTSSKVIFSVRQDFDTLDINFIGNIVFMRLLDDSHKELQLAKM